MQVRTEYIGVADYVATFGVVAYVVFGPFVLYWLFAEAEEPKPKDMHRIFGYDVGGGPRRSTDKLGAEVLTGIMGVCKGISNEWKRNRSEGCLTRSGSRLL